MHYYGVNTSDELYHHGVLGMKWGVRRYQRKDGSLTSAGLHRYDKDRNKLNFLQKHNNKLIEKYKAKGYGENAAQIAAKRQMRVEAAVAGVVAKNVADQRIINAYLEKHPNTKLTDKEILKAVRE